ncbi:putative amidoligase enzyme-domain-containing protein [Xylaria scruposa]|nr:putative amidoligase enzyme-domain-containing protein [Xylaria scruposa]
MFPITLYHFGIEIELVAKPRDAQNPLQRQIHYNRLARSLEVHGLPAKADNLNGRYSKHPEHYDKWWITRDGSLGDPSSSRIPFEAVSPTFVTSHNWAQDINGFWLELSVVFNTPDASNLSGSHIHVSPYPMKAFSLSQLKMIAIGIIFYEPLVHELLPECRQHNGYCRKNTLRSRKLKSMGSDDGDELWHVCRHISKKINDAKKLRDFMQKNSGRREDRNVLWNFDNVLSGRSGSIEFRGGPGLRGPTETHMWISFVLAFIHLCLDKVSVPSLIGVVNNVLTSRIKKIYNWIVEVKKFLGQSQLERYSMNKFWEVLTKAAKSLNIRGHLPSDWSDMR